MIRHLEWGVLVYTFHPYVIGRGHRMLILERLTQQLLGMNAEFMTMGQAVDEFLKRRKTSRSIPVPSPFRRSWSLLPAGASRAGMTIESSGSAHFFTGA